MKPTVRLGRVSGIEVGAHWSVGMIFALVSWALAASLLPEMVDDRSNIAYAVAGLLGGLGLIVSIVLHELSHAVVATRDGVVVKRITIWMLGGVAMLGGHARTAESELRIALAGPLSSVAIGVASLVAALSASVLGLDELIVATLGWLTMVNLSLAVFNMLPGAPLDGGRVVAGVLWQRSGDEQFARWRAARAGVVLGQALVAFGLVLAAAFGRADGIWMALIGWFVLSSAHAEETAAQTTGALGDLTVGSVMTTNPETARAGSTIARFVHDGFGGSRHATFPLLEGDLRPVGVVTLSQIRRIPRHLWETTTLLEAGTPLCDMTVARPDDRLVDVLAAPASDDGRILVLDSQNARLVGVVTPSDVARAFNRQSMLARPGSWMRRGT